MQDPAVGDTAAARRNLVQRETSDAGRQLIATALRVSNDGPSRDR